MDNAIMTSYDEASETEVDKMYETVKLAVSGIVGLKDRVEEHDARINMSDKRITSLEARMEAHERSETISGAQAKELRAAVHHKVAQLLGIKYDKNGRVTPETKYLRDRYFGRMVGCCWNDAKKNGYVANWYIFTLRKDYDAAMHYIQEVWMPKGGVEAFKAYVDDDIERKAQSERAS